MNAVATIRKPTQLERFVGEVLPADNRQSFYSVLPRHISPDKFERALVNAIMANTDLMEGDPRLIFREVSKVVGLGLSLDPQLGEAYLILGWNGKTRQKEPQVRIGYKGIIKLAKQSGEILNIYAREVHKNDEIECIQGDENRLIHKPHLFTDRGPVVGYYAVVKYKSGEIDFEPMSIAQIHEIRDRSDGWKAFKDNKIKSTPWSTDEGEMSKKTVLRRLGKRVSQSAELADAIGIEDKAEFSAFDRSAGAVPPPAPARRQVQQQPATQVIEHRPEQEAATDTAVPRQADAATDSQAEAGDIVSKDTLLTELDEKLSYQGTTEAVEEAYTDFDAEALLSDYEGGVEAARTLKAQHLDRVHGGGGQQQDDGGFPGDEALALLQAGKPDSFTVPERFKGGGHYQIFIRDACAAAKTPEDGDRLRLVWSKTKPQRDDLAAQGQVDQVVVNLLVDEIKAALERIAPPAAQQDDVPPPAPKRASQATVQTDPSPPAKEAATAASKAAADDPIAAYGKRQEASLEFCTTKEEVTKFWVGACDERDESGATEGQRLTWKAQMQRRKGELPAAES